MEDQQLPPVPPQATRIEEVTTSNPKKNTSLLAALITILLIIIAGTIFGVQKIQESKKSDTQEKSQFKSLAKSTIIYGYWTNRSSVIRAFDLNSGSEATLATLERNIKHVKVLNNHTIVFIKDTDEHDYGKEVVVRDIESNIDKTIISADKDFGIDDYKISPNGEFMGVWMVGTGSNQFTGSPSRVYTVNTSRTKNLIYDEITEKSNPVHYPVSISNEGQLFTDRFLPNSGAGWGYGMSVSDFTGNKKSDILIMKNGTYSSQPDVSRDGRYLGFAGYSGSDGTVVIDGYRKALTVPDTVEILDTTTLTRSKVTTGLTGVLYSSVSWDALTNNLLFQSVQKDTNTIVGNTYSYSPSLGLISKLSENPTLDFFADLSEGKTLLGQKFQDRSGVGNLGSSYAQSVNKFYIASAGNVEPVPIGSTPIQLIDIMPPGYFPIVDKSTASTGNSSQRLSIQTFEIKPSLAPQRTNQQSDPPPVVPEDPKPPVDLPLCRTISYPQCNQLLGTNYPTNKDIGDLNDKAFSDCVWKFQQQGEANSTCLDSPLYLYGVEGTNVRVRVGTEITNTDKLFNDNILSLNLKKNGNRVAFDYTSKLKYITPPKKGWLFEKNSVAKGANTIAKKFGFNKNEENDFVDYLTNIRSPYLFISFFDQRTSQNILPLYFDPIPVTYRNTVFYVKKLISPPDELPVEPDVTPINRVGFTAIEISFLTE